jgi:hypothetical protein
MRESFLNALAGFPLWAILRAFDAWERQHRRRPSPGEIVALAKVELEPFTRVFDDRHRQRQAQADAQRDMMRKPVDREAAAEIMARAGFTPKRIEAVKAARMANTFAEAEAMRRGDDPMGPMSAAARAEINACPAVKRAREEP